MVIPKGLGGKGKDEDDRMSSGIGDEKGKQRDKGRNISGWTSVLTSIYLYRVVALVPVAESLDRGDPPALAGQHWGQALEQVVQRLFQG